MSHLVYGIEGLDRLGKSTLIQGILDKLGYYKVIHFAKPQKLEAYENIADRYLWGDTPVPEEFRAVYLYQRESFRNSMLLARTGAKIIFDRWHIGEVVYSPMYRGYSGDYVFDLELNTLMDIQPSLKLILLIEDF